MSFFRANLIGLKADRDKKEIGMILNLVRGLRPCFRLLQYMYCGFDRIR